MSNIQVKIAQNLKKESVFINPNMVVDKVIRDKDGNIVDTKRDVNVISKGTSRMEAVRKAYGRKI